MSQTRDQLLANRTGIYINARLINLLRYLAPFRVRVMVEYDRFPTGLYFAILHVRVVKELRLSVRVAFPPPTVPKGQGHYSVSREVFREGSTPGRDSPLLGHFVTHVLTMPRRTKGHFGHGATGYAEVIIACDIVSTGQRPCNLVDLFVGQRVSDSVILPSLRHWTIVQQPCQNYK